MSDKNKTKKSNKMTDKKPPYTHGATPPKQPPKPKPDESK
ncbi:hypothetical protein Asal01_00308 [Fodinibius salicampi]